MKRFTETTKWRDPWFFCLSAPAKVLWIYLCDCCDSAGVVEVYLQLAARDTGLPIEEKHLEELKSRLQHIHGERWIILGFIRFQYGKLSRDCKPHAPVFASLERYGIAPDALDQNAKFTETVSVELRRKIIMRDGSKCVYTGKQLFDWEIQIDHILPRSLGGTCDPSNLVVMDKDLNAIKKDLSVMDFCNLAGLNYETVRQRLSEATSKAIKGYLGSLQEKEKEKEKVQVKEKDMEKEGGLGETNGELDPVFVKDLLAAYRRPADSRLTFSEQSALAGIIRENPRYRDEWDMIIVLRQKEPRYFPQSLSRLLNAWQETLDRAMNWAPDPKQPKTIADRLMKELDSIR